MPDLPEHEERRIREYVDSQFRDPEDRVTLVQKVGERHVVGHTRQMYDVHTASGSRWWVISDPLNYYPQQDFPQLDMAFTYHLGVSLVLAERSRRRETDRGAEEDDGRVAAAWRRFQRAADAMDSADEAEHYQALGVMCREALLALVRDLVGGEWLPPDLDRPRLADFKGWAAIHAEALATGRRRAYLKAVADKTWDLCVWLQHYSDATEWDAHFVLDATGHCLDAFSMTLVGHERGSPERCPRCGSYRLDEDGELVENEASGWHSWQICAACGWRSTPTFNAWDSEQIQRAVDYLELGAAGDDDSEQRG